MIDIYQILGISWFVLGIIGMFMYYKYYKISFIDYSDRHITGFFTLILGPFGILLTLLLISEEHDSNRRQIRDSILYRPKKEKDEIVYITNSEIYNRPRLHSFLTDAGYKYKKRRGKKEIDYSDFDDKLDDCYMTIGGLIINKTKKTYKITRAGFPIYEFGIKQNEFIDERKTSECPPPPEPVKSKHPDRVIEIARDEYTRLYGYNSYRPSDDIITQSFSWDCSRQGYDTREKAYRRDYDGLREWKIKQDYEELNKERGIDKFQHGVEEPYKRPDFIGSVGYGDGKVDMYNSSGDMVYATDMVGSQGDEAIITAQTLQDVIDKMHEQCPTHKDYKEPKRLRDIISL